MNSKLTSDELVLLERVFLRIGSADTDEQLQTVLGKFLPPVLLKLSSHAEGVRKKVMELLVHVNKRLKSRPKIQLPVRDLLAQYQDPSASPFVTNFTIIYIKMGFPRMEPSAQAELLPTLMTCLDGRPAAQQENLMQLIIPALQHVTYHPDLPKRKEMFKLDEKPDTRRALLDFMMDNLLLPYSNTGGSRAQEAQAAPAGEAGVRPTPQVGAPPGLSEVAYKRVTGDTPPSQEELEKIKQGIINMLGSDIFPEQNILCHYIVGLADGRHSVANAADRELKRITANQDWNSPLIVNKLYSIFQGTVFTKGQQQPTQMKPEYKRKAASIQLRMKIFPYLLRSREAANYFPACVQIVFDCLYGTNTNQKLKVMAVQFVHHLCFHCTDAKFQPIGPVLLTGMVKLIGEAKEDSKLRGLAYVAVGKIAKRVPKHVSKDIALLQTFFEAMCKEESENRLAVQEALSMMASAFKNLDMANMKQLEALIMQNIEKPEPQARLVAAQYAIAVFPPDHIPSRYVLLLACGDMKEDIYAEASKALRKLSIDDQKESDKTDEAESKKLKSDTKLMPAFTDMVNYIQQKSAERVKSSNKYVIGNNVLPFNPAAYVEILMYLRMCLAYNAGVTPDLESMPNMKEQAPAMSDYVNSLLQAQPGEKGPIAVYISIIRQLLNAIGGAPAMYCLLEIVAVARKKLAPQFIKNIDWIKGFAFSSREEMREFASELYALVVTAGAAPSQQTQIIQELTTNLKSQAQEGQHGSMLTLGHLVGGLLRKQHQKPGDVVVEDMEVDESAEDKARTDTYTKALIKIGSMLDNSSVVLSGGACTSIGEIGRSGPLPVVNEHSDKKMTTKLTIIDNLIKKVQTTKDNPKVREKAASSLGYICVGDPDLPFRKKIIEGMLESAQPKQMELHFTIGESLVHAAQGTSSPAGRDTWLITEQDFKSNVGRGSDDIETVLKLLLTKYSTSPNPHIRQAACIWLLSITKKCGHFPNVQSKLKNIQVAFMNMLGENDDITQDIASKGLGVVYENCSKEQKDELVSILVDTLMTGKRPKQELTGDTEVFQDGALGKTPDGKSLSTYKELCSIANDLNQPDLIYKFMHLANHNAMWNSKKGAAFGFTTIATQAGEQLTPYLHKIVPKLYRYQFDPNPQIRQAMTSIWTSLVPETKKTVDKYLREITGDLIFNLTSNQWRNRESSCMALNDLLRGRQLDEVVERLPELWETIFRVQDDIKESVRNAAEMACKTLSRVSIKMCDPNYGKVGSVATSMVLPCLLQAGLGSQVKEVRAISLSTILKIAKSAGPLLKPHIPVLVAALLEALSGLEPQVLNYLSLRVGDSSQSQERLDSARLAASKTSPMMEVINMCMQYVDEGVLAELIPRIIDLIKSGVGLGTKAGCANVLISLTHHCPKELAPYAGKLLGALLNGLNDRNSTVKKTYATTIGHIVKVAKDSSVEKLIGRLKDWYLEKEDESVRQACGVALQAISRKSSDILKRHAALAMPLAFLAMHEKPKEEETNKNDHTSSVWEDVWLDTTPGTEGGIRLYLPELVEITQVALESQSWHMKAQGASAMKTVATKLGSNLGPPHLGLLLSALLAGLSGRTWVGKEALLHAVSSVCVSCKEAIAAPKENQPSLDTILDAVMKECRKESIPYKQECIQSLGPILETHKVDRYQDIQAILFPLLHKKGKSEEEHDVDKDQWLEFEASGYECLGAAWPHTSHTQSAHQVALSQLLTAGLTHSVWRVEVAILKTTNKFITRLCLLENKEVASASRNQLTNLLQPLVSPLCQSLGNVKYSAIRIESLGVVELLVNQLSKVNQLSVLSVSECEQISTALQGVTKNSHPELQDRTAALIKVLATRRH